MSLRKGTSSALRTEQSRGRGLTLCAPKVVQCERKPGRRTVTWEEAHEWQRDNKYVRRGYRPGTANLPDLFASMTFLHNETCNVYTHLIGAILMPLLAPIYMRVLSDTRLSTVHNGRLSYVRLVLRDRRMLSSPQHSLSLKHVSLACWRTILVADGSAWDYHRH